MELAPLRGIRSLSRFGRYAIATLAVAAAGGVNALLTVHGYTGFAPVYFAAIIFTAWIGGIGPGLFATVIASLAAARQFPLSLTYRQEWDDTLRLLIFATVATGTVALHAMSRRNELQLRIARQNAVDDSAAKDRFLAMVTHELKNPLNPILLTAQLVARDSRLPDELRQDIAVIQKNAQIEARLIDDLLDLARIGSGKLRLNMETVRVRDTIAEAIHVLQEEITHKRIQLETDIADNDLTVLGDPIRLQQIFWNLLRNAVKFTPIGGSIKVSLWQEGTRIITQIADNGVGIEPARLTHIFEAFRQGSEQVTRRFGGLGLGLAIAKSLVAEHGGTITATSQGSGLGTTLRVELPAITIKPRLSTTQPPTLAPLTRFTANPSSVH